MNNHIANLQKAANTLESVCKYLNWMTNDLNAYTLVVDIADQFYNQHRTASWHYANEYSAKWRGCFMLATDRLTHN